MSGIPGHFLREDGEEFWGGYENRTDIHYEDGWRDEVIPEYNPLKQSLGDRFYDAENDVVTYPVIELVIDVNMWKQRHLSNLAALRQEIATIIMQIKLSYDPEPEALTQMTPTIRGLYPFAKDEIAALTEENICEYVLRGPQVNGLFATLNSML